MGKRLEKATIVRAGLLWLSSMALFPLAGWLLLSHESYRRLSIACRIALAGATGVVLISFWMTLFALGRWTWRPILLVFLTALTAAILRLLLKRAPASTPTPGEPRKLFEMLAVAVAAVSVVWAFLATASGAATSMDLILFWGPKAQDFAAVRTIDAGFLSDPALGYMHSSYPPLVTNVYAFATMAAGRFVWRAATLTFPLLLAALALALPDVLRRAAPRRAAWACAASIVSAFGFLGSFHRVAGNGEPFLWLFETLAMTILIGSLALERSGQLLAGLFLAGAAAAKIEGFPFVLAAVVLFFLVSHSPVVRRPATFLLLFLPTFLFLGVWFAFGAVRHLFLTYESYGSIFAIYWGRLPSVLAGIGKELWSGALALPFFVPLAALFLAPGKSRRVILPLATAVALSIFFLFTYLNYRTDPSIYQTDPLFFIHWSAGRVFSPITAFLAIASLARRETEGVAVRT